MDDELDWCDECLARFPRGKKHDRPKIAPAARCLYWFASRLRRLASWIGEWGDVAQMRANRRAGLSVPTGSEGRR